MKAPNVLLVVLDAVRRDALEPYGAGPGSTPAIASLARRGHALPLAYSTSSWTLPAHASMFTGLLPRALGLGQAPGRTPAGVRPALESAADQLLASMLREAGYATHGFSANLWVSGHAGFDVGFDTFTYASGGRNERLDALSGGRAGARTAWALEGLRSRADDGAAELGRALRTSIAQVDERPCFWFVNLVEGHSPYLPPRPWNDLGPLTRMRAALDAQRHLTFEAICLYATGARQVPPAALERMRHLYARAVSYMDAWLADVLEALDRRGELENTLVIVTSDHGESFGEGGYMAHGFALSEPLIHVPLVLAGPGAIGRESVFSLAELPGVIAAAAGVREHPIVHRAFPDGIAIAQYDAIGPPEHPRFAEFAERFDLSGAEVLRLATSLTCATDGVRKLVVSDDGSSVTEQRYDLVADPGERAPLADGSFDDLRAALEVHASPAVAPAAAGISAEDEERAELERQMKLLGYM
jgi:arylsulfatase A-like enzyme